MLLYYERGEVSMGLLYCGANIQPTSAAELMMVAAVWRGGNFQHSMQYFEGLTPGLRDSMVTGADPPTYGGIKHIS